MQEARADLTRIRDEWLAAARREPTNTALGVCLVAVLAWVYGSNVHGIAQQALRNVLWYHCLLVPFGAAWIWYRRRESIRAIPIGRWWGGGIVLLLLATALQMAELGSGGNFFGGASLVCACAATIALLQGRSRLRQSAFPLAFLMLGVPIPLEAVGALGFPLQHISALLTAQVCRAMGLPVLRDGVVLTLGDFSAVIAGSCSGMNSLFALLLLGAWILGFSRMRTSHKVLAALAILPTVVVANVARLVIMLVVALLLGGDVALSFFHEGSDIVLFLIVLSFLIAVKLRLEGARVAGETPRATGTVTWTWE